jgi:polyvinyl alcohol dehydrogenase (cytochrome)
MSAIVGGLTFIGVAAGAVGLAAGQAGNQEGSELYSRYCASCHDGSVARAPVRSALAKLPAEAIRSALTTGSMSQQGAQLSSTQREQVVAFLSSPTAPEGSASHAAACPQKRSEFDRALTKPHWNGWGVDVAQSRFQPASMARLTAAEVPALKMKWAFGVPDVGQMYGQPTVVGGRVFEGTAAKKVYSLDAESGCVYWTFDTEAPVRTAITIGQDGPRWLAYFGDQRANAYAVDALTGELRWKVRVEEHPVAVITGAPTLAGGVLYVPTSSGEEVFGADPKYRCCTFRGSVTALDASTGKTRWRTYTIAEEPTERGTNKLGIPRLGPSGAAVWSSPTVDLKARRVYVTTGDSYSDPAASTSDAILAFDAGTGALLWARQMTAGDAYTIDCDFPDAIRGNCPQASGPDFDFGTSPMLIELGNGRRALVAGQKSGVVHAVDPDRGGEILWQTRVSKGGRVGGVEWGMATDGERVFAAVSDAVLKPVPPDTPGAQRSALGALTFDSKVGGGLFALDARTGKLLWTTPHPGCGDAPGCSPAQSAAVTAIPGVVFSGGLDGHLRAYAAATGKILWDVNTKQEFATVNGVKANGGSLDAPGAVVVGGTVFVNSGYTFLASAPGNVLLAFAVPGRK